MSRTRLKTPPLALLLLALMLASACLALPSAPASIATPLQPTFPPPPTGTPLPTDTPAPTSTPTALPRPPITRVVIISIDGLRPDAIDLAPMPVLQGLIQSGAYSLTAQTIFPSVTLPSHTSMLTGLCPAAHGVTWNEYLPERGYARGTDLFDLAHAAGLRTVMVTGKEKLRQITEPGSLDLFRWVNDPDPVIGRQAAALIPQGFGLLFIHLPDGDLEGHTYGWMSLQQLLALRGSDEALGTVLKALDEAQMRENTLVIVTADHGGHNTTHGFDIPADMTIPWVANGPGIVHAQLASRINTTDTAATAAWALGLSLPGEWAGRPVLEAFGLPDNDPRPEPRCP